MNKLYDSHHQEVQEGDHAMARWACGCVQKLLVTKDEFDGDTFLEFAELEDKLPGERCNDPEGSHDNAGLTIVKLSQD